MNDSELNANFKKACVHYAKQYGYDGISPLLGWSRQTNPWSIIHWHHNSIQPTIEQLKSYTVDEVNNSWDVYKRTLQIQKKQPYDTTLSLVYSGPWSVTPSSTIQIHALGTNIKLTFLKFTQIGDGTTSGPIKSTNQIPYVVRPNDEIIELKQITENGEPKLGVLKVDSSGFVTWYSSANNTNFTANAGSNGYSGTTLTYDIY